MNAELPMATPRVQMRYSFVHTRGDGHVEGPPIEQATLMRVELELKYKLEDDEHRKLRGKLFRMKLATELRIEDMRDCGGHWLIRRTQ